MNRLADGRIAVGAPNSKARKSQIAITAEENSDFGLLCLITRYMNFPLYQSTPAFMQSERLGEFTFGCGHHAPNGYGKPDVTVTYLCGPCFENRHKLVSSS